MRYTLTFILWLTITLHNPLDAQQPSSGNTSLRLNDLGYLEMQGLDVTVFSDSYPEGHQGGITIIQHGKRVAANGDLRLEATPGYLSPTPKAGLRHTEPQHNRIVQNLSYPDPSKNGKGFNPIEYPKLRLGYKVSVEPHGTNGFVISVDLNKPLPEEWVGKVGFNLELYPEYLLGKSFILDKHTGHFPHQASYAHNHPIAQGQSLSIAPEEEHQRINIHSNTGPLSLWDSRGQHKDGWFVVHSPIKANTTTKVIEWIVTPNVVKEWHYQPVLQVSQVGYASKQTKVLIIEQENNDTSTAEMTLFEITPSGKQAVYKGRPKYWGHFLRYEYLTFNFSYIDKPGVYIAEYKGVQSHPFKIDTKVFSIDVWQPTLEYFLPIQMCHMKVVEKNKLWHDECHLDDALMSPMNHNHFNGYYSSAAPLTQFKANEPVPNLNAGGWHSGSTTELNLNNQLDTIWLLSTMLEEFELDHDASKIDQESKTVLLQYADGVPDALQQVEHGLISTLAAYETMGRLYQGIISQDKDQFEHIGEISKQTDGVLHNGTNTMDERWIFIEESPDRALEAAAVFSASARVLRHYRPKLAKRALTAAKNLYIENHTKALTVAAKTFALTELYLTTNKKLYLTTLQDMEDKIIRFNKDTAWRVARILPKIESTSFRKNLEQSIIDSQKKLLSDIHKNPYGVPYKNTHKGIVSHVQNFGIKQYFLHKAWPQHVNSDGVFNALQFVLGVHPGSNTASFVSGVGSHSVVKAFGTNRGDGTYIPGGVVHGTSIAQPNLPELLESPYLKQQTEYNIANAAGFMFLALSADKLSQ